jgi:hypothetical protein
MIQRRVFHLFPETKPHIAFQAHAAESTGWPRMLE